MLKHEFIWYKCIPYRQNRNRKNLRPPMPIYLTHTNHTEERKKTYKDDKKLPLHRCMYEVAERRHVFVKAECLPFYGFSTIPKYFHQQNPRFYRDILFNIKTLCLDVWLHKKNGTGDAFNNEFSPHET